MKKSGRYKEVGVSGGSTVLKIWYFTVLTPPQREKKKTTTSIKLTTIKSQE